MDRALTLAVARSDRTSGQRLQAVYYFASDRSDLNFVRGPTYKDATVARTAKSGGAPQTVFKYNEPIRELALRPDALYWLTAHAIVGRAR